MATFPRTPDQIQPQQVSRPSGMMAAQSMTQRGSLQTRDLEAMGNSWKEQWLNLKAGDPDVESLLAFIRLHARKGTFIDIKHVDVPGSGRSPNGTGTSGVTVNGGGQTGSSISTTGWPASTSNVVRAGDVVKLGALNRVFEITADANSDSNGNATLSIDPPILSGNTPADGSSVTTTDVLYRAIIRNYTMPQASPGDIISSVKVTFREAV